MMGKRGMIAAFLENTRLLQEKFGIEPLLYGSLGLELRTGEDLGADDIDILVPGAFVRERWDGFRAVLEENGYRLIDVHEHEFEKDGMHFAYAQIEGLDEFAGVRVEEIETIDKEGCRFMLLDLRQYLQVYEASVKDGYRIEVRGKKDAEKIRFIKERLAGGAGD